MKYSDLSNKNRLRSNWLKFASASLLAVAIAGCGGGSDGAAGPAGPAGADGAQGAPGTDLTAQVNVGNNTVAATPTATAAWKALAPQVTVTSVTINSAPVVKFTVKDAAGKPILGLANYSQSSTATVKGLTNIAFTLAKLVPGTNNEPSKWVSYNVYKTPTVLQKATAPTVPWYGTWPATDAQGTLVDCSDTTQTICTGAGNYQYTFMRDPKQAADIVAALPDALPLSDKKDLGDVSYDPTLTHRLGIQIGGAAPGTGSNTPTAVTVTPGVNMVNTANVVYDFRPDGAAVTNTRDVVSIDTCGSCHQTKVLAHGSRKDPRYCVTCHTDQVKYSINGEATPVGAMVLTGTTNATTSVVDGRSLADFPNMVHKVHMGSRLKKQGYNFIPGNSGNGVKFNELAYPQDVLNCTTCHDGSATAAKKTTNGDNWKSVPSILACGSCHDGINFATGQGTTAAGATTGHIGGAKANNAQCVLCHDAASNAADHPAKLPTTADAAKRTMSATISKVQVGATDGSVTVTFSVKDAGVAVTDITKFTKPAFGLIKLVPAANGESSHWVSYTSRFRTKSATMAPVLQGSNENTGTLTANVDGTFSYKFALLNGSTPGDINTITHAHNTSTIAPYAGTAWTGAAGLVNGVPVTPDAGTGLNVVAYEPTLTHRVAMSFAKVGTSNVDNATNAYFDFVPAGGAVTSTRNIVTMDNCATCHAGGKLHSGYATQYCVQCHNQGTGDPFTGETVDLQRLVHKVHMGSALPSVKAGGSYVVNGTHDYSKSVYPGSVKNCTVCHSETAVGPDGKKLANATNWYTTPTKRACATCHDSAVAVAHVEANIATIGGSAVETCVTCHAAGKVSDVRVVHGQ